MNAPVIRRYGERAVLVAVERDADRRALFDALRRDGSAADVILAEELVCAVGPDAGPPRAPDVTDAQAATAGARPPATEGREHEVLTVYDGEDLPAICAATGAQTNEVIARHAGRTYTVSMMGFLPGFAYLRELDERLVLPRRPAPRTRVPAGSVAISAQYTAVYPFASPGGWHLVGRAVDFTALEEGVPRFALGDRVRFTPVDAGDPRARTETSDPRQRQEPPPPARGVGMHRVRGLAIVIDDGRVGFMHAGVPRSGPLSRSALGRANAAAGNRGGAPAIELYGGLEIEAVGGPLVVADDAGTARHLAEGERASFSSAGGRVRYVAVRGGADVPRVMGSASTLLVAGVGGFRGRALRRGDVVAIGVEREAVGASAGASGDHEGASGANVIETLDGPDAAAHPEGVERLARATWRVSTSSDRTGTRLEDVDASPTLHDAGASRRASIPMIEGAVQLTPTGPVVLGPDHPTTGGYPVIAVVSRAGLEALSAIPLGATLRLAAPISLRGTLGA